MISYKESFKKLIIRSLRKYRRTGGNEPARPNGEWGYQLNVEFYRVIFYMLDNYLESIVDLGAGVGHCLEIARRCGFRVKGYEINDELIHRHRLEVPVLTVEKKSVMSLTAEDIKKYEVVYSWCPFKDNVKELMFLEHINSILSDDQVFYYFDQDKNVTIYTNEKSLQL